MLSAIKKQYRLGRLAWLFFCKVGDEISYTFFIFKRLGLLRSGYHGYISDLCNLGKYVLDEYFSDWDKARMSMLYDGRNVRAEYQYGLNNKRFSTAILEQYLRVQNF